MAYDFEQSIFPDFPRTQHLPAFGSYLPNASSDDKVADVNSLKEILPTAYSFAYAEEKIDGSNSGIMHCPSMADDIGQPFMLRNRNHILRKGYTAKTKGKQQFIPFWNWYYANVEKFEKLNKLVGFEACVYGEWLWPENPCTIIYDKAPDKFIAYDIWDAQYGHFMSESRARLIESGFAVPPLLLENITNLNDLLPFLNQTSPWSAPADKQLEPCHVKREGVYIKVREKGTISRRYKMVRSDYKPGLAFGDNKVRRKK